MQMANVGPITNGKLVNTGRVLSELMDDPACQQAALASAYVTKAGLRRLLASVKRLVQGRGRTIRILTGLKDYFTDPEALAILWHLARKSKGRLVVRVSRNLRFHAKLYLVDLGKWSVTIVGSANLTSEGLATDGELSALIKTMASDKISKRFWAWFDKEFTSARDLDERLIETYRRARKSNRPVQTRIKDKRLLAMLRGIMPNHEGSQRAGNAGAKDQSSPAYWRGTIDASMSDKGMAQLREAATWFTGSEPDFICYANSPSALKNVRTGDYLFVFDSSKGKRNGWVKVARVIETHDYPPTNDGRCFLVLRYCKKGKKRLTTEYLHSLVARGFFENKASAFDFTLRRLGQEKLEVLKQDFTLPKTRKN
jgi:HKD family nuclease